MKRRLLHIWVVGLLLVSAATVNAQTVAMQGSVVVHSDPRLSVLLSKPHNNDDAPTPVAKRKTPKAPRPVAGAIMPVGGSHMATTSTTAATEPVPVAAKPVAVVSTSAGNVAATVSKPLPLDENGHVAGWTPPVRKTRLIYSGKGFRVQIYNGADRSKAIAVRASFMRSYPGVRTYLSYISPAFRVKVGDYRNRSDAAGMLREANSTYSPSMIVPDIITISTF